MIIKVRVKPGSKAEKMEKISDRDYRVSLRERAEDNKANIALLRILKKKFNKDVKLIKGVRSKNKIVRIGWKDITL